MFYIDTATNKVSAYRYNVYDASITFECYCIEVAPDLGCPDGCKIDEEGMIWIALWNGHCITRWNPENGELLEKIDVPALNVTSLAFGGPDLDTLYITTARINTPESGLYPNAGSLFAFKPGVRGMKMPVFRFSRKFIKL